MKFKHLGFSRWSMVFCLKRRLESAGAAVAECRGGHWEISPEVLVTVRAYIRFGVFSWNQRLLSLLVVVAVVAGGSW